MQPVADTTYLRRYTDIPALLHLLKGKQLTLLDPATWDDKNDSYFMSIYKEKKKFKTVLGLCFSQAAQTYHHWRVFANSPSGVCIVFNRSSLLDDLESDANIQAKEMEYLTLSKAKDRIFKTHELPFIKRYGFKPEKEFRVIYTSMSKKLAALSIPIQIESIQGITLSPWMHATLSASTSKAIRSIEGCENLKISRSTLISNDQWKIYGESAV